MADHGGTSLSGVVVVELEMVVVVLESVLVVSSDGVVVVVRSESVVVVLASVVVVSSGGIVVVVDSSAARAVLVHTTSSATSTDASANLRWSLSDFARGEAPAVDVHGTRTKRRVRFWCLPLIDGAQNCPVGRRESMGIRGKLPEIDALIQRKSVSALGAPV